MVIAGHCQRDSRAGDGSQRSAGRLLVVDLAAGSNGSYRGTSFNVEVDPDTRGPLDVSFTFTIPDGVTFTPNSLTSDWVISMTGTVLTATTTLGDLVGLRRFYPDLENTTSSPITIVGLLTPDDRFYNGPQPVVTLPPT